MSTIQNNPNYSGTTPISGDVSTLNIDAIAKKIIEAAGLPPASDPKSKTVTKDNQLPSLPSPSSSNQGLSLENLLASIDILTRKLAAEQGIDAIEARSEERKIANDEKIKEIQENLEKSKSKGILDIFMKVFQAIGAVVSAIGAAASIVVGAMTGNPLMIAAGCMMAVMAVDQAVSLATDGKVSIAAGASKLFEAMGVPEDIAKWIGVGVQIAMAVVTIALSLGAASGGAVGGIMSGAASGAAAAGTSTATTAASTVNTVKDVATTVKQIATIAAGIATIAQGATTIASAVNAKEMADSQAYLKEIEAILERITMMNDIDLDYVKELLQKNEQLLGDVSDIVDGVNQANTAIQTGAPAMA